MPLLSNVHSAGAMTITIVVSINAQVQRLGTLLAIILQAYAQFSAPKGYTLTVTQEPDNVCLFVLELMIFTEMSLDYMTLLAIIRQTGAKRFV